MTTVKSFLGTIARKEKIPFLQFICYDIDLGSKYTSVFVFCGHISQMQQISEKASEIIGRVTHLSPKIKISRGIHINNIEQY